MIELINHIKEYDPEEIFKSRTEKTLIHCPNPVCGEPIGSKLGNTWWFRQKKNGKSVDVKMEMKPTSGTSYKVNCTYCGYGHIFAVIEENINIV